MPAVMHYRRRKRATLFRKLKMSVRVKRDPFASGVCCGLTCMHQVRILGTLFGVRLQHNGRVAAVCSHLLAVPVWAGVVRASETWSLLGQYYCKG